MINSDSEPLGKVKQLTPVHGGYSADFHPLLHYIPPTRENHFFYRNGLSKLIPRLAVKVHSRIDECYDLWERFSPKQSMFDLWDFRYSWYEGYQFTPYFYTLYERGIPLAVLPLWWSDYRKKYLWFGSDWMEDNNFFVANEKLIDVLFQIAPNSLLLNAIEMRDQWVKKKFFPLLKPDDPKNLKNLEGIITMDQLLQTFDKKSRYHLRSDYLKIQSMNPRVIITKGKDLNKLNRMITLNIERFSKDPDDESDLVDPQRRKTYERMVRNADSYDVRFIEVYIQNHLAAIDFIATYQSVYYTMKGGNDIDRFSGIGNYMVYIEFEDALRGAFRTVDCLQMDNGWKHRFFDQKRVYTLEK